LIEDAALAVSELVTNAIRHGLPPVGLLLRRRLGQVRMDVNDARPGPVTAGERPGDLAESGRGLEIVDAVADESGSEHIPGDGKFVYAAWNVADQPAEVGTAMLEAGGLAPWPRRPPGERQSSHTPNLQ